MMIYLQIVNDNFTSEIKPKQTLVIPVTPFCFKVSFTSEAFSFVNKQISHLLEYN